MKIAKGLFVIAVSFALGFAAAYFAGTHSERTLILAKSAYDVDLYTRLLDGLHGNQEELMKDRLETLLDYSIIDVSREYSAKLDMDGNAAKSLVLAKNYRVAHPHRNEINDVAKQVDAALATTAKATP